MIIIGEWSGCRDNSQSVHLSLYQRHCRLCECGLCRTAYPQYTIGLWMIKRGFRKEIAANSGRSRLNLTGALDLISRKILTQEDKTLNAESTIAFLNKIEENYPKKSKIHLFCDNARYYRNKSVTAFLEKSKISMHFLPPYSPNLNPIERVWKWMKERVLYNTYYEFFDEFKVAIFGFFKGLDSIDPNSSLAQSFVSRIKDNFRPIGAPVSDF